VLHPLQPAVESAVPGGQLGGELVGWLCAGERGQREQLAVQHQRQRVVSERQQQPACGNGIGHVSIVLTGTKNNYLIAYDNYGLNSAWQQMGTWTVPGTQHYLLTTTVGAAGGGTISPNCPFGCLYNSGTVVTVSATQNSGLLSATTPGRSF
jgi:hypothetical protein